MKGIVLHMDSGDPVAFQVNDPALPDIAIKLAECLQTIGPLRHGAFVLNGGTAMRDASGDTPAGITAFPAGGIDLARMIGFQIVEFYLADEGEFQWRPVGLGALPHPPESFS